MTTRKRIQVRPNWGQWYFTFVTDYLIKIWILIYIWLDCQLYSQVLRVTLPESMGLWVFTVILLLGVPLDQFRFGGPTTNRKLLASVVKFLTNLDNENGE